MFSRCIFCHAHFPENRSLEHLRRGRRIAFDPARGRLWTVCGACARWTLAPIEERWEALEELDRLATDRARLLSSTHNVALLRTEELVRVGRAERAEEAWWRYGRELLGRRRRSHVLAGVEFAASIGLMAATGGFGIGVGGGLLPRAARWFRFGSVAAYARSQCPACGVVSMDVGFEHLGALRVVPGRDEGEIALLRDCFCNGPGCGFLVTGPAAHHALRRSLAYLNFGGASEVQVRQATDAIERAGSAEALVRRLARIHFPLRRSMVPLPETIALEIAASEENERRLLEMELWELERRWKEEEEIAAIVDRELSFRPGLDRLLGRRSGRDPAE
jgi:hypothetical protein